MPQSPLFLPNQRAGSTAFAPGVVDAQGAQWVGQRHGLLYESAYQKSLFLAANQAGVTTTVGLATTYVGICLSNPLLSGVNLSLINVSGAFLVAPSTVTTVSLSLGFSATTNVTHTTALTPASTIYGTGPTPKGLVDSSATLPTAPVIAKVLAETPTATTSFSFDRDLQGGILVPPGGYALITTNIASPASGFVGSMLWAEVAQ